MKGELANPVLFCESDLELIAAKSVLQENNYAYEHWAKELTIQVYVSLDTTGWDDLLNEILDRISTLEASSKAIMDLGCKISYDAYGNKATISVADDK